MKAKLIILVAILVGFSAAAQTAEEEYDKIAKAYENVQQLGFRMDIELYASFTSSKVVERQSIDVHSAGKMHYNKMGQLVTITDEKHQLLIDHEHQIMVLGPRPKVVKNKKPVDLEIGEERLKEIIDASGLESIKPTMSLTKKGDLKGIKIDFKQHPDYEKVIIWYNGAYMIKSVEFFYANALPIIGEDQQQKPRMIIRFTDYNYSDQDDQLFDLSGYLKISRKEVAKTVKYNNYRLLNNTQLTTKL